MSEETEITAVFPRPGELTASPDQADAAKAAGDDTKAQDAKAADEAKITTAESKAAKVEAPPKPAMTDGAEPKPAEPETKAATEAKSAAAPTAVSAASAAAASAAAVNPAKDQPAGSVAKPGGVPTRDRTGRVKSSGGAVRPARKARLRLAKLDPWSVMKTALMFSIAAAIILFVAVALLWSVIEASGALDKLQETVNALLGNPDGSGTVQVSSYIDRWRVLGFTAIICGVNVILLTALSTLAAFLYNLSSTVLGGLELTLAED